MDSSIFNSTARDSAFFDFIRDCVLEAVCGTMKLPVEISQQILHDYSSKMSKNPSPLLTLPYLAFAALVDIFYRLDIVDQSVLALSCKHLASTFNSSVPQDLLAPEKKPTKKSSAKPKDSGADAQKSPVISSLIMNEIARRKRPATRLRKLEFLLRFHHDGVCKAMPGYRLCLTCATFKLTKGAWGGDTSYLRKRKVSNEEVTKGPRCSRCSKVANDQVREAERAWKLMKKLPQ